jgi:ISXO2-like transposase domain/Transposase zinc-ribbon domain
MARKQPKQIPQMTVAQFEAAFPNEDACDAYLVARRWPNGIICPRCGSDRPYELKTMKFKWECPDCSPGGYRFSNIAGTIFENTNVDLRVWYRVIHLLLTSKKGMSARQIHRYIGFGSYKTAWYMCHRIRAALVEKDFDKLGGVVEVDETFIGGKAKNKHLGKGRGDPGRGGLGSGKVPVVGAVSRKGNVVARVIDTVSGDVLTKFVMDAVSSKVSLLVTDEWIGYHHVKKLYPHEVIKHTKGEYVVGAVHTNTIEGFWSILKRGIVGSYHKVSKKYLPLYVAEFQFRYNNRHNPDIFGTAIAVC